MPLSWLHQAPFTTWTLPGIALLIKPGIALLIGVAVPQLTALGLLVSGHRWALAGGYLAGIGLVLWIAVQMLVLQRCFFMQPVIAAAGPWRCCWPGCANGQQQRRAARQPGWPAAPGTDPCY